LGSGDGKGKEGIYTEFAESTEGTERKEEGSGRHRALLPRCEQSGEDEIRLRAQGGSIYVDLPRSMKVL
jgi:hypothetical protein